MKAFLFPFPIEKPWFTRSKALLVVGALVLAMGCKPAAEEPQVDLVLVGGHVLDVVSGEILQDRDVWIDAGQIVSIVESGLQAIPSKAKTVDTKGQFLVPGLVDAHVHLDHVDELQLYISQGVTTVFNLRGVPRHLKWRDAIAGGELEGPTIYTAGDYMDGFPPFMQPMMSFENPEEAAASVRAQHQAGYDMVKVYTRLKLEQLNAITAAAHEVGLPVVGHGSGNYPLEDLIASGQLNIAHGQDLLRWYSDGPEDEDALGEIVEALRGTGTTVTANLSFTAGLIRQGEDLEGLLEEPMAKSLPAAILQPFRRANNRYIRDVDWVPSVKARFEKEKRLAGTLHAAGVKLLAGTDASTAGVLPGSSMILEVELLVEAGLSPLDALRAATLVPGRFAAEHIDANARFGQITEGYRADILVLPADPLKDVSRLSEASGVVVRGRWYERSVLDERLATLAERNRDLTPHVIELEEAIKTGDLAAGRKVFDTVRAEDPGAILFSQYLPFFIGYGFLYGDEGYDPDPKNREAALMLYEMYAETYPNFHSSHYMLALAQEANGKVDAAVESLRNALAIHPYYPNARQKLADLTADSSEGDNPTD